MLCAASLRFTPQWPVCPPGLGEMDASSHGSCLPCSCESLVLRGNVPANGFYPYVATYVREDHSPVRGMSCLRERDRRTELPRVMHLRDARSRLRYVFVRACFVLSDSSNVFLCQGLAKAMCSPCSSSLPHAPRLGAWILDRATYNVAYRVWARHTPAKPIASPATQRSWGLSEGLGFAANDSYRIRLLNTPRC